MHINVTASASVHAENAPSPGTSRRRTASLPQGHAAFCTDSAQDTLARRLSTPLATLRNSLGNPQSPGEARALANAQQLVSAADAPWPSWSRTNTHGGRQRQQRRLHAMSRQQGLPDSTA